MNPMKRSKKILLSVFSFAFAYYLGVYSLAFFNGTLGGYSTYGHSMEPTIFTGDRFIINKFERPRIGDIISFTCLNGTKPSRNGSICDVPDIVHRLVSIDPDGCMHIYGDNPTYDWPADWCLYPDEIDIHGVVHKLPSFDK